MKFIKAKLAVAAALAMTASTANAGFIDGDDVIVNILNTASGESMLVNTDVPVNDFLTSGFTWSSNDVAGLTAAIDGFLGADAGQFWVAQATNVFGSFGNAYTTVPYADPNTANIFSNNIDIFTANANTGDFGAAPNQWLAGIAAGTPNHYSNPQTNTFVGNHGEDVDVTFIGSELGAGTYDATAYDVWRLDSGTGELTYGSAPVIPVPAAVWLFGSGLLGLVGVARRRA